VDTVHPIQESLATADWIDRERRRRQSQPLIPAIIQFVGWAKQRVPMPAMARWARCASPILRIGHYSTSGELTFCGGDMKKSPPVPDADLWLAETRQVLAGGRLGSPGICMHW
jgi:hypothetical protein